MHTFETDAGCEYTSLSGFENVKKLRLWRTRNSSGQGISSVLCDDHANAQLFHLGRVSSTRLWCTSFPVLSVLVKQALIMNIQIVHLESVSGLH